MLPCEGSLPFLPSRPRNSRTCHFLVTYLYPWDGHVSRWAGHYHHRCCLRRCLSVYPVLSSLSSSSGKSHTTDGCSVGVRSMGQTNSFNTRLIKCVHNTLNRTAILTEHCHERPPVLKDQIFLAEGPTFQCNWTSCHQRPPVLRDHVCMANGVVFQGRFYCMCITLLHNIFRQRIATPANLK